MRKSCPLVVLLTTAMLALLAAPAGAAAPGGLDPTFGSLGTGVTSLGTGTELNGVAVQPDGQVVAVGDAGPSLLVARFSASGALEATFAAGSGVGRAIVIQPDGKIVVAGNDSSGMLIERFNPSGSLDAGFGVAGVVHAAPQGRANALALGPGGTIIAAGQVPGGDSFLRIALVRLLANGSPDTSIGPGGLDVVDLGKDSVAKGVAVQADGKIVLAGSQGPGTQQVLNALVARVNASGSLDKSFGGALTGVFSSYPQDGGGAVTLNAVALDPAGGIDVGGGGTGLGPPHALFLRLTCAGTLDTSFAGTGQALTPSGNTFIINPIGVNGIAVAAGGQIVGAGQFQDSGLSSAALWGFGPNGSASVATRAPSNGARAAALVIDSAGDAIAAGTTTPPGFPSSGFVARYIGFGVPTSGGTPCGGNPAPPPPPQPAVTTPPPPPVAPSVATGSAAVVSATSVVLSGSVNPNGQATSYRFNYGPSVAYGSLTSVSSAGAGTALSTVSARINGLKPGTTYHYRLAAINTAGAVFGADRTFRTLRLARPSISRTAQSNRAWGETRSRGHKRPLGTTFSFTLNESARVTLAFTQQVGGRRVRGRCVAQTKKNRGRRLCRRTVTRGRLAINGHAGRNRVFFRGRISRLHQLRPGRYTLVITATNVADQRSRQQTVTFTILS